MLNRRRWLQRGCACGLVVGAGSSPAADDWAMPERLAKPALDTDEGGLWATMDREETKLRRSPFRLRDGGLAEYISTVACRLAQGHCPDVRVYTVRMPYFNASMAPNGMMQVWSGLLLRMENEAQLAAVLGHEIGHYMQRHSVLMLRDVKARSAFAMFFGMLGAAGLIGQMIATAGLFAFSREHEREADRIGIDLMRRTDYDPREAAKVWANLLEELRANPKADPTKNSVLFATHPPSEERRLALEQMAEGSSGQTYEAEFRARIAPYRVEMLEEELKRGRPEESIVLLSRMLGREPQSAQLMYFRAEAYRQRAQVGDLTLAQADLEAAATYPDAMATVHRSLGAVYKALDRADAARKSWQQYLSLAPAAPDAALIQQVLQELPP